MRKFLLYAVTQKIIRVIINKSTIFKCHFEIVEKRSKVYETRIPVII